MVESAGIADRSARRSSKVLPVNPPFGNPILRVPATGNGRRISSGLRLRRKKVQLNFENGRAIRASVHGLYGSNLKGSGNQY
jgi:hypothetical protein